MRHKWWRLRARNVVAKALSSYLDEPERVAEEIFDALEAKGLRIVRDRTAPGVLPWTVTGMGPFRMPGERRRWAEAEERARDMLDSISKDEGDG